MCNPILLPILELIRDLSKQIEDASDPHQVKGLILALNVAIADLDYQSFKNR